MSDISHHLYILGVCDVPGETLDLFRRKKKRTELDDEVDDLYEVNEDSDLPITEKKVKQKKIRTMK